MSEGDWWPGPAPIRMQKMTSTDDLEAYLHTFERVVLAVGWPRDQWTLILIPCLVGLLQEVVDTLSTQEATVKTAILLTLNLTEEAYRKRLTQVEARHPPTYGSPKNASERNEVAKTRRKDQRAACGYRCVRATDTVIGGEREELDSKE